MHFLLSKEELESILDEFPKERRVLISKDQIAVDDIELDKPPLSQ